MTTKKPGRIRAEKLMADPRVVAHREAAERTQREAEERERQETSGLRAELAQIGIKIDLIWDLVNSTREYDAAAVPILIDHLKRPYDGRTREGIARALSVRRARPYAEELIKLFKNEDDAANPHVKWAIGNALAVVAGQNHLKDIIQLSLDLKNGRARSAILSILARSKKAEAKVALLQLVDDPEADVALRARRYVSKNQRSAVGRA